MLAGGQPGWLRDELDVGHARRGGRAGAKRPVNPDAGADRGTDADRGAGPIRNRRLVSQRSLGVSMGLPL